MTKAEIFVRIQSLLHELFETDPAIVKLESNLYTDLDVDSIDAIDLAVELKNMTGKKIKPEDFKNVRTVSDVVEAVHELLSKG